MGIRREVQDRDKELMDDDKGDGGGKPLLSISMLGTVLTFLFLRLILVLLNSSELSSLLHIQWPILSFVQCLFHTRVEVPQG